MHAQPPLQHKRLDSSSTIQRPLQVAAPAGTGILQQQISRGSRHYSNRVPLHPNKLHCTCSLQLWGRRAPTPARSRGLLKRSASRRCARIHSRAQSSLQVALQATWVSGNTPAGAAIEQQSGHTPKLESQAASCSYRARGQLQAAGDRRRRVGGAASTAACIAAMSPSSCAQAPIMMSAATKSSSGIMQLQRPLKASGLQCIRAPPSNLGRPSLITTERDHVPATAASACTTWWCNQKSTP
jgi:hypothetical protein